MQEEEMIGKEKEGNDNDDDKKNTHQDPKI